MSIVHDQIRRLDLHVDRLQLSLTPLSRVSTISAGVAATATTEKAPSSRSAQLKAIVRTLSATSGSKPLLPTIRLLRLLEQTKHLSQTQPTQDATPAIEEDLEWLVVAKATVQVYGMVMESLLQQLAPISDEMWYWEDILTSQTRTSIYTIQTAPLRLIARGKEIWADVQHRYRTDNIADTATMTQTLSNRWRRFYGLVQQSVSERSLAHARTTILSPFALCRSEAQKKQNGLRKLRELTSSGLGLLVDEGLVFPSLDSSYDAQEDLEIGKDEWRNTVQKSIALIQGILKHITALDTPVGDFEETVFTSVEDNFEAFTARPEGGSKAQVMVDELSTLLMDHLPSQLNASQAWFSQFSRPPRLVRYWLPGVVLLLSGSTILRIVANRRAEIISWVRELGSTTRDFWLNWVIEPVKKLIGTIRHDEASEVALMSKDSLQADRASLERMVVEFAADHPENGTAYSQAQLDDISSKVKQGDLTPVLKAYERDLRSPFVGTIRGDLIRALLIQVQKTKVDVEVAIGGIDSLLKSQELVFGFVSLTPGLLVSVAVFRWLTATLGSRKGGRLHRQQGETIQTLRNIDRILSDSTLTDNGMLSYKDHGMLICEVHVLRQKAIALLPARVHREFLEDVDELADVKVGVHRQSKTLERIRWAYGKWLK